MYTSNLPLIINEDTELLILGSFPSVKSRDISFYYGNKQNRFWKMLAYTFEEEIGESKEEKTNFVLAHHIGLFDVVKEASIKGSQDATLEPIQFNDVETILKNHSKIKNIICNGNKSFDLLSQYFKNITVPIIKMSSTSPANTRFDINIWKTTLLNILK